MNGCAAGSRSLQSIVLESSTKCTKGHEGVNSCRAWCNELHWDFDGGDVDAAIREYIAFGVRAGIPNDGFVSRAWRVLDDGSIKWDYRYVDLSEDDVAVIESGEPQVFLRELARDAREWREACAQAEARQEAEAKESN